MGDSRIKILTIDRPKMTYDISAVFVKHSINITWMEVYTYVVYVKFPEQSREVMDEIISELHDITGIEDVQVVDFIILEEKELEVRTVLNSIKQGIVIIDKTGYVKYLNEFAAKRIFDIGQGNSVGKHITSLDKEFRLEDLLDQMNNNSIPNEMTIRNKNYIVNINPIISDDDILSSYMITFEDMGRIGEIFKRKNFDNLITFDDIFGASESINKCKIKASTFAQSDSPVMVLGESGTGKELFARAIHNESSRSSKMFVALNCAAIPDQLLESELFGYEEGAFTGGKKSGKKGLLELADGGTVFLDEIGEMPPHLQVKLLRVLQEKSIRRLGGNKELPINVRIITATNRDITKMVEASQFRLDLYYRINVFTLNIPPLRERVEDIEVLVNKFIKLYIKQYNKKIIFINTRAMEKLKKYGWPGNVRELQNVIERAIAVVETDTINPELIVFNELSGGHIYEQGNLKETVERIEKEIIKGALKKHRSIRETAKKLGVTHTLLINRIKKYDIEN